MMKSWECFVPFSVSSYYNRQRKTEKSHLLGYFLSTKPGFSQSQPCSSCCRKVTLRCKERRVKRIHKACKGLKSRTEVTYSGDSQAIVKKEFQHEIHAVIFYKSILPNITTMLLDKPVWQASTVPKLSGSNRSFYCASILTVDYYSVERGCLQIPLKAGTYSFHEEKIFTFLKLSFLVLPRFQVG